MPPTQEIEARFSDRQRAAIDRAIQRFRFTPDEARAYFRTLYAAPDEQCELLLCAGDPQYFITEYCQIYVPEEGGWIPFDLWPEQIDALNLIDRHRLVIILKARQLGLTWLALSYALWLMLFRPIATILIYSKRDDEAIYLLSEERLRGVYRRLPAWMHSDHIEVDNATQLKLANSSVAYSFPTTAGDSYTATFVLGDEADLMQHFDSFMRSVKPTIDGGGKLLLVSRADKTRPESQFKRIYKGAKAGINGWVSIFLAWWVRPERTQEWHNAQKEEILARTGGLDDLFEQYPETDVEALAGRTVGKRINPAWLKQCYEPREPLSDALLKNESAPAIPGLQVYRLPIPGRRYCFGADPAEGNPTSDDSAAVVLDELTGEQVALLSGKFEPSTLASHVDKIGVWYNYAPVLVERNNHGHAVILWLRDNSRLRRLHGWDTEPGSDHRKEGWLSNSRGKALLYDGMADAVRDQQTIIHSDKCFDQLSSIDGSTLRAPEMMMDDCADAYALAVQARNQPRGGWVG